MPSAAASLHGIFWSARVAFVSALLVCVGCGHTPALTQAPYNMIGAEGRAVFEGAVASVQTPEIRVLYFTNRLNEREPGQPDPVFGHARSDEISFGAATVSLSPTPTWEQLVRDSTSARHGSVYRPSVSSIESFGTIPSLDRQLRGGESGLEYPAAAIEAHQSSLAAFNASLEPWLKPGDENEVLVYVHGFNNTFRGSVIRLAMTWHSAGRRGVPIVFAWPAGSSGFLPLAYNHDRESGEYSVPELKVLLTALAANERVAGVHLLAHSRGTDVVSAALRELSAEIEAVRGDTLLTRMLLNGDRGDRREREYASPTVSRLLKLKTLVLVAPDIDLDLFEHRFFGERAVGAAERVVVYTSPRDRAISISTLFFESRKRLGGATLPDFEGPMRDTIARMSNLEIIECDVHTRDSHSYLFEHPGAMADMIAVIRDRAPPGAEHGRPLDAVGPGFWRLSDDYLAPVHGGR